MIPYTVGLGDEREVLRRACAAVMPLAPVGWVEVFDMSHTGSRCAIRPRRVVP